MKRILGTIILLGGVCMLYASHQIRVQEEHNNTASWLKRGGVIVIIVGAGTLAISFKRKGR